MLVVFPPIFVAGTKIFSSDNFTAPLRFTLIKTACQNHTEQKHISTDE